MPASYVFSELLKVPIFFLHRIDTLSIICLDDMLLKGRTAEDETPPRCSDSFSARGFGINCRLCNKLRNVCNDSHTRDIVPTSGKKFKRHDYLIWSGKIPENQITLPGFRSKLPCILGKGLGSSSQPVYPARLNCRFSPAVTNSVSKRKGLLSRKHKFKPKIKTGTSVVDQKYRNLQ